MKSRKISLQIWFEPSESDAAYSRLFLCAANALIRSYPMSLEEHYHDLYALKFFLSQKTLRSIMLGNEPVAEIEFSDDSNLITMRPYGRLGQSPQSGSFKIEQGLDCINTILDDLAAKTSTDRDALERQVRDDIRAGVYDVCLTTSSNNN